MDYIALRGDFKAWLSRFSEDYSSAVLRYLDRFLAGVHVINEKNLTKLIESADRGRRILCYSLRVLFNFLEERGMASRDVLDRLRRVVKIPRTGSDGYVPSDREVVEVFKSIRRGENRVIFKLLAYTGLRVVEASRLLVGFNPSKLMYVGEVAKYPLQMFRRTKKAFYAYMPRIFAQELRAINVSPRMITYRMRRAGLPAKYLRKWNYNFLISNGVPESVADFIQGRAPVSVGSMHYLARAMQADRWYGKVVGKLTDFFSL